MPPVSANESGVRLWAFRLAPGADLKRELAAVVAGGGLRAAFVATCVGSLSSARLRLPSAAGAPEAVLTLSEPMEIISLAGTLSPEGLHLHMAVAGSDGGCVGGHLLDGCIVRTTAEVVLGELTALSFARQPDAVTGYRELAINRLDGPADGAPPDPRTDQNL